DSELGEERGTQRESSPACHRPHAPVSLVEFPELVLQLLAALSQRLTFQAAKAQGLPDAQHGRRYQLIHKDLPERIWEASEARHRE
ncbi:hypothetical protein P7K49_038490, partial [Saguinus oedipus]